MKANLNMKVNYDKIDIEVYYCELEILPSDDGKFHFETDKPDEILIGDSGGVLIIQQRKRELMQKLFGNTPVSVELRVPDSFRGDLYVWNDDGSTEISSLTAASFVIKSHGADVDIAAIRTMAMNVHSDSGDVDISGSKIATAAEITTLNGGIDISGCMAKHISAESTNGDVELSNCTAETIEAKNHNGDIEFSGVSASDINAPNHNGDIEFSKVTAINIFTPNQNGDIELANITADTVEANSKNGDISISMNGAEADYTVRVSTINGSLKVGGRRPFGAQTLADPRRVVAASSINGDVEVEFGEA